MQKIPDLFLKPPKLVSWALVEEGVQSSLTKAFLFYFPIRKPEFEKQSGSDFQFSFFMAIASNFHFALGRALASRGRRT